MSEGGDSGIFAAEPSLSQTPNISGRHHLPRNSYEAQAEVSCESDDRRLSLPSVPPGTAKFVLSRVRSIKGSVIHSRGPVLGDLGIIVS